MLNRESERRRLLIYLGDWIASYAKIVKIKLSSSDKDMKLINILQQDGLSMLDWEKMKAVKEMRNLCCHVLQDQEERKKLAELRRRVERADWISPYKESIAKLIAVMEYKQKKEQEQKNSSTNKE